MHLKAIELQDWICVCVYIYIHTHTYAFFSELLLKKPDILKRDCYLISSPELSRICCHRRITRTNQIVMIVMITFLKDLWCFAVSVSAWRRYCQIGSTSHKTLLSIQWNDSRFLYTFREAIDQNCVSAMCSWVIGCVHACAVLVFK